MTNVVITPNQTRSVCPEKGVWNCSTDKDCPRGNVNNLGEDICFLFQFFHVSIISSWSVNW